MRGTRSPWLLTGGMLAVTLLSAAVPRAAAAAADDFATMELEDLLDIEVRSVSKRSQKLVDTASAVYVITSEDIRRSGLSSVPELLRLAPGLQVARISANRWAISSRGFNHEFSNKLLVLVDGRSVYTPLFSGVFWDEVDVPVEDIERIEVIRGPGATVWGANAVNGVINIIRKPAEDTPSMAAVSVGTEERLRSVLRWSRDAGERGHLRFTGQYRDTASQVDPDGHATPDQTSLSRLSMRGDWQLQDRDTLLISSDYYDGAPGVDNFADGALTLAGPGSRVVEGDVSTSGGNVLARWERTWSEAARTSVQAFYTRAERDFLIGHETRDMYDLEWEHEFALGTRQHLVAGGGYRLNADRRGFDFNLRFSPEDDTFAIYNVFLQDEIAVVPDRLSLTLGTKLEWNDFSGWEIQPSGRFLWHVADQQQVWGAVSRAARMPSRADTSLSWLVRSIPSGVGPCPALGLTCSVRLTGDEDVESEYLSAYELGYRWQPTGRVTFDLAGFWNSYENVMTFSPTTSLQVINGVPTLLTDSTRGNDGQASAYGVEAVAQWAVRDGWRVQASYTGLEASASGDGGVIEGSSPYHQVKLHSYLDLPANLQLDSAVYLVGHVPYSDVGSNWRFDLRLGWRPRPRLELSVGVQDLLDGGQDEWSDEAFALFPTSRIEIQPNYYGKLTWSF